MKYVKKLICGLLALCLLISMLPVGAWGAETEPEVETVPETTVFETQESTAEITEAETTVPVVTESVLESIATETVCEATEATIVETEPDETAVLDIVPEDTISMTAEPASIEYTEDEINAMISSAPYPDRERPYWIIFYEGYRNDRVEMSIFNLLNGEEEPYIVWNRGLELNDGSGFSDCNQYYIENSCWSLFVEGYDVLSDYSTGIIASNLDIYDGDGNLICKATNYPGPGFKQEDTDASSGPVAVGEFSNSRYEVYDLSMSWTEAKAYCEELGGYLAVITSDEEMNAVLSFMQNDPMNMYWIGLSRDSVDAEWKWITEEPFIYSNWAEGEPNNDENAQSGECFVQMYAKTYVGGTGLKKEAGQWNDAQNDGAEYANAYYALSNTGFICEYSLGKEEIKPVREAEFGNNKYEVYDESMTWTEAKAYCEELGGHLATITSTEEQTFIESLSGGNANLWIGGYRDEAFRWYWVTGEKWEYTNWGSNQPDNSSNVVSNENCLAIWPKLWNDLNENNTMEQVGFICEYDAGADSNEEFNGHTYRLYDNCTSWEEAKAYCESLGGHLATITSEAENAFLYAFVVSQGIESAYFGLTDSVVEGTWKWCNGETVNYLNWHSGEPNGENSEEDYAMFYYKYEDGTWNDGDFGGSTLNGGNVFICEWDNSVTSVHRTEWIQKHMEYAASSKYQEQVSQGFTGALYDVFEDIKKDPLIRAYSTLDSINSIFDYDLNLTEAEDYELLLAQILFTRSGVTSIEEMYDQYLSDAIMIICEWMMTQAHITESLDEETVNQINTAIDQLKSTSEDGSDYYLLLDELLSFFKGGETLEFGEAFVQQFNDAGFEFGVGFSIEQAALTCQTLEQCVLYLAAGEAYCKTSDAFAEMILAMRKHIFIQSDNPIFEPYPVQSALVTEQQILSKLGYGNDPLNCPFNMRTLATALEDYYVMLSNFKNGDASSMANKLAENYINKTFDNIMDASLDVALSMFEKLPVVNTFSVIKKCFKAGQFAIDKLTTIDEREYYGTMLMRAYVITYIHYLTVDNLASTNWNTLPINVSCSLEEYQYDRAHQFDEAVTVYRAILTVAATYAAEYCSVQYNFVPDYLNNYYSFPHLNKNVIQVQDQQMSFAYEWCHSTGLIFEQIHAPLYYDTEDLNLLSFKCPVQITIRDENGAVFAVLNDENSTIAAGYEHYFYVSEAANRSGEYIKIAAIPKTYSVSISGTGMGSMDVFVSDYLNSTVRETWCYLNVPVEDETEGTLEDSGDGSGNVVLYIDGAAYDGELVHEHVFVDNKCEICGVTGGACGDDLAWILGEEGTLHISGTGAMYDFETGESPWDEYRNQIKEIILPDGLIYVGDESFRGLYKVKHVSIPGTVTEIGSCAFITAGLTSVSLPEGLLVIGESAFQGTRLRSVDIPDSLTSIGDWAFHQSNLESVYIPTSVTEIGRAAFADNNNLQTIKVDSENTSFVADASGVLYNKEMTTLYQCPGGFSGEYVIPKGVTTLESCAFDGCTGLTKVTIPDSVMHMPWQSTFGGCVGLTELILPDEITSLCYAFAFGARQLEKVKLPEQLERMDSAVFYGCTNLTKIVIPKLVTEMGSGCFAESGLNSVVFCGSAPEINKTAFKNVKATAYYPGNDTTWTADVLLDYGGTLTWIPYYGIENVTRIEAEKLVLNPGESVNLTAILDPGVVMAEDIIWTLQGEGDDGGTLLTGDGLNAVLTAGWYMYDTVVTVTAQTVTGTAEPAVLEITIRERPADYTLFSGKSMTLKEYNAETGKYYSSKQLVWSTYDEYAPYVTLTSTGRLTAKKVVTKARILIFGDIDGKPGFMRVVDILPTVTHAEILEGETVVNGQTRYMDFDEESRTFTVSAYPLDTVQSVTWNISDATKKAYAEYVIDGNTLTVTNPKGKVGTVTVKATVDAGTKKTVSFKLSFADFAESVTITNEEEIITSGDSLQLTAVVSPDRVTKAGVTWKLKNAADKSVASISKTGLLKTKTVYRDTPVTLVATTKDGLRSAEYTITVIPKDTGMLILTMDGENVTKSILNIDLNTESTLSLSAENLVDGAVAENITWKSSSNKIATVEEGMVLIHKNGNVTITAEEKVGKKVIRKAVVTLKISALTSSVTIEEPEDGLEVASGKSITLKAACEGGSNKVTWSIVKGAQYAKISSKGKLTANKDITQAQEVQVVATAADGSEVSSNPVTVTIRPLAQGVQIYSEEGGRTLLSIRSSDVLWVRSNTTLEWAMNEMDTLQLSARVYPYYNDYDGRRNAIQGVTWKSSSPKIASVNEDGTVTCIKPGTVTITATASDGSSKKVSFKLKVIKKTENLNMEDQGVKGGKSLNLTKLIQINPTDATYKTFDWEIMGGEGAAYASINAKGILKAKKVSAPMDVDIRVTAQDGSGEFTEFTVVINP